MSLSLDGSTFAFQLDLGSPFDFITRSKPESDCHYMFENISISYSLDTKMQAVAWRYSHVTKYILSSQQNTS